MQEYSKAVFGANDVRAISRLSGEVVVLHGSRRKVMSEYLLLDHRLLEASLAIGQERE